ncbi:MAG: hypothetical protein V3V05_10975 [Pontiella sp.]
MSVPLIDGITAFFTTKFEGFFNFLKLIKSVLEKMFNNRVAMFTVVVTAVKSVYDFSVAQINKALASFETMSVSVTDMKASGELTTFLAFGNAIFPLSEGFAVMIILFELWLICTVIKLILRLIPTI